MIRSSIFFLILGLLITSCVTTPESGKSSFILTSEAEENRMGLQAYQEILKKEKVSTNSRMNGILQRVGQRIAQAARKPSYQWQFTLIESPEKNAFCLPGGKVAVYTGILSSMKNEAAMAAVIGHEVAHATARHGGQRMTTGILAQGGLAALGAALGQEDSPKKNMLLAALGVGTSVGVILPFSRSNETEADEIGLVYMARAGYEPREASHFWDRFGKDTGGSKTPAFLSTHPASEDRKNNLASLVSRVMPEYERSPKYGMGETF